jgi:hypothetical protein
LKRNQACEDLGHFQTKSKGRKTSLRQKEIRVHGQEAERGKRKPGPKEAAFHTLHTSVRITWAYAKVQLPLLHPRPTDSESKSQEPRTLQFTNFQELIRS